MSSWEIAIKHHLGRLSLPEPPAQFMPPGLVRDGIESLSVQHHHAQAVAELPDHHRDPFDRLLVAQDLIERLTLVSADPKLPAYDVARIWSEGRHGIVRNEKQHRHQDIDPHGPQARFPNLRKEVPRFPRGAWKPGMTPVTIVKPPTSARPVECWSRRAANLASSARHRITASTPRCIGAACNHMMANCFRRRKRRPPTS